MNLNELIAKHVGKFIHYAFANWKDTLESLITNVYCYAFRKLNGFQVGC